MRPYVSIDIETTGLDPETCQILEIGAIIDDWTSPVEKLPRFHCYVTHKQIKGEAYALSMHFDILRAIAERRTGRTFLKPYEVGKAFAAWLTENHIDPKKVFAAGKNFASFDLAFLRNLGAYDCPFKEAVNFHHRFLDPGNLLFDPALDHDGPPDSKTCMQRCGLPGDVKHTALEDAEAVVKMIRFVVSRHIAPSPDYYPYEIVDRMPAPSGPGKLGL